MRAKDIEIGGVYEARVSGSIVPVRVIGVHPFGGWWARSLTTRRTIRARSAQRFRRRLDVEEARP